MNALHVVVAAALVALSTGCERMDAPVTDVECGVELGRVSGSATAWRSVAEGEPMIRVEGTAKHQDGLAILGIEVAGVGANPDAFNFGRWSVELPVGLVRDRVGEGGAVDLSVMASDACGRTNEIAVAPVSLQDPPSVNGVEVTVAYPGGEDHLPSTLSVPAAVTVSASGEAAGIAASLSTERGAFVGASPEDPSSQSVRLAAVVGGAEASTYVTTQGAEPGEALVTATALQQVGVARLRIAGPPLLTPAGGSLLAGGVQPVDVATYGRLVSCEAMPPEGVSVTYAGRLLGGVVAIDDIDGRRATLLIEIDGDALEEQGTFVVTCRDAYGQATSASFRTPPPSAGEAPGGEGEGEDEGL